MYATTYPDCGADLDAACGWKLKNRIIALPLGAQEPISCPGDKHHEHANASEDKDTHPTLPDRARSIPKVG